MSNFSTPTLNPSRLAKKYLSQSQSLIADIPESINVVGLIASDDRPSIAYANATKQKFNDIGLTYDLRQIKRLDLEDHINALNADPGVHGIFIYFPIFNNQQDDYLRNLVDHRKDIEAGSNYWTKKLYANDRLALADGSEHKAVLPCTPLAIIKMLTEIGVYKPTLDTRAIEGKVVTIFNRSEVIGRPLAVMMSNDGGKIFSFDEFGPLCFENAQASEISISREAALAESDIVITGVPSKDFPKIQINEVKQSSICINFSSFSNFADDIETHADAYIPRVGPMTVAMCIRNTLRLYESFHRSI